MELIADRLTFILADLFKIFIFPNDCNCLISNIKVIKSGSEVFSLFELLFGEQLAETI